MKKVLILMMGLFMLSCHHQSKENPKTKGNLPELTKQSVNFDWLLGNWKRVNEKVGKETFEYWEKLSEIHYLGIGYTMEQGDTLSQEIMNLVKQENTWNFIVKTHEGINSTLFSVKNSSDSSFTCTNDSNDFPKMIKYWNGETKLNAIISGDSLEIAFEFEKIE